MPITSVTKDLESLTMTVVADFPAPLQRLWDAYADPRQIERFWGPPEWPSRFTRHDMAPGGRTEYVMAGPDGEESRGFWEFVSVDAPHSFEVIDGFADTDGSPSEDMPTIRMVFAFEETPAGSRLITTSQFGSLEQLEQLIEMGMEEGMTAAMSQIDDVLADLTAFASDHPTEAQILNDTQVRISRVIRGSVESVWVAHHDADLMRRWMLGPDGWTMAVCEVATEPGQTYRYEWERVDGTDRFGFTGELVESRPPHRSVTTEQMIGVEGSAAVNEMTLTAVEDGTLLSIVITYPSPEVRDLVLESGMVDGMETSYSRLEDEVLADTSALRG